MPRCFLTGVEFPLESAFVINRRAARDLLDMTTHRMESLRRLLEQLGPLDDSPPAADRGGPAARAQSQKHHRLVCKAVADAMASAYPEIRLFLGWHEYKAQVRTIVAAPKARSKNAGPPPTSKSGPATLPPQAPRDTPPAQAEDASGPERHASHGL